jgi:hypothetical protein
VSTDTSGKFTAQYHVDTGKLQPVSVTVSLTTAIPVGKFTVGAIDMAANLPPGGAP